ncbi:hypothetical protein L1887_37451 [Cichorium endivia]|nr:hypothetical protein L1887_37451 [Cichorium endivia]
MVVTNSPIFKELCKTYNLPQTSLLFFDATITTFGTRRTATIQARDLTNPTSHCLMHASTPPPSATAISPPKTLAPSPPDAML